MFKSPTMDRLNSRFQAERAGTWVMIKSWSQRTQNSTEDTEEPPFCSVLSVWRTAPSVSSVPSLFLISIPLPAGFR